MVTGLWDWGSGGEGFGSGFVKCHNSSQGFFDPFRFYRDHIIINHVLFKDSENYKAIVYQVTGFTFCTPFGQHVLEVMPQLEHFENLISTTFIVRMFIELVLVGIGVQLFIRGGYLIIRRRELEEWKHS